MARHYSQTERSLICTHEDHTFATCSYAHASDIQQVGRTFILFSQTCRKKHFSVITQHKLVGPVTYKPKLQDSSCFTLFILCTRILKIFFLSVGVCILHRSAFGVLWTLLFLNLDFTDLCGFYISCRVGEKRAGLRVVFYNGGFKAFHWEINSSTSWHSSKLKKILKKQLYSLIDETIYNFVNSVFIQ